MWATRSDICLTIETFTLTQVERVCRVETSFETRNGLLTQSNIWSLFCSMVYWLWKLIVGYKHNVNCQDETCQESVYSAKCRNQSVVLITRITIILQLKQQNIYINDAKLQRSLVLWQSFIVGNMFGKTQSTSAMAIHTRIHRNSSDLRS